MSNKDATRDGISQKKNIDIHNFITNIYNPNLNEFMIGGSDSGFGSSILDGRIIYGKNIPHLSSDGFSLYQIRMDLFHWGAQSPDFCVDYDSFLLSLEPLYKFYLKNRGTHLSRKIEDVFKSTDLMLGTNYFSTKLSKNESDEESYSQKIEVENIKKTEQIYPIYRDEKILEVQNVPDYKRSNIFGKPLEYTSVESRRETGENFFVRIKNVLNNKLKLPSSHRFVDLLRGFVSYFFSIVYVLFFSLPVGVAVIISMANLDAITRLFISKIINQVDFFALCYVLCVGYLFYQKISGRDTRMAYIVVAGASILSTWILLDRITPLLVLGSLLGGQATFVPNLVNVYLLWVYVLSDWFLSLITPFLNSYPPVLLFINNLRVWIAESLRQIIY